MTVQLNLNSHPYFDDYDETKGFHKILFHPAKPVQARELTQIQTILQEQIKRNGDHMFKNGTVVIPGHVYYDDKVKYLKLETNHNGVNVETLFDELKGKTITGENRTVGSSQFAINAFVSHCEPSTVTNGVSSPTTIYIKYTSAAGTFKTFNAGETLTCADIPGLVMKVKQENRTYTGNASICTIDTGIYYINGFFVEVLNQTVVVSKYGEVPSKKIGLNYLEEIITENEDESLYDNAAGFTNFGAPGAHRLKIGLTLVANSFDITSSSDKFIELVRINSGKILMMLNDTKYAEFERLLARRTMDESGNYIVKDVDVSVGEYRNNNRGAWTPNTPYLIGDIITNSSKYYVAKNTGYSGSTAPVHAFGEKNDGGISWQQLQTKSALTRMNGGTHSLTATVDELSGDLIEPTITDHLIDEAKLNVKISPMKAYIDGFEVDIPLAQNLVLNKSRDIVQEDNTTTVPPTGNYILITNIDGLPNTNDVPQVNIRNYNNTVIGTANVRNIELHSGTPGQASAIYKLFIFNIKMNSDRDFNVEADNVANADFTSACVLSTIAISGVVSTTNGSDIVTGIGTQFYNEIRPGQKIDIAGAAGWVSTIDSMVGLTLQSVFAATQSGVGCVKYYTQLLGADEYIKKLPHDFVSSLRDSSGENDVSYIFSKTFTASGISGTSFALTATGLNETFETTGHLVVDTSAGTNLSATFSGGGTTTLTVTVPTQTNHNYRVIAVMKRQGAGAKEKIKTLQTKTIYVRSSGTYADDNTTLIGSGIHSSSEIKLTEADVVRITNVFISSNTNPNTYTSSQEIILPSFVYTLATNATEMMYDQSGLKLKISNDRALRITFEYFEHSPGDYFSVNSYSGIRYEDIPSVVLNKVVVSLRDCLDFRPRKSDDGINFTNTGASVPNPLVSYSTMDMSYSYYISRIDLLTLDNTGSFDIIEGVPAIYPIAPSGNNTLSIAQLKLSPYSIKPSSVVVDISEHRGYTMKDINLIEKRVENVEYYVALNELEKTTATAKIVDENGLDRYKNGFIADNFENDTLIDSTSSRVTFDPVNNQAYPLMANSTVQLFDSLTTESARSAKSYTAWGDYLTLPFTTEELVSQSIGTSTININPFNVLSNNGSFELFPSEDNWTEDIVEWGPSLYEGPPASTGGRWNRQEEIGVVSEVTTSGSKWARQRPILVQLTKMNRNASYFVYNGARNISKHFKECGIIHINPPSSKIGGANDVGPLHGNGREITLQNGETSGTHVAHYEYGERIFTQVGTNVFHTAIVVAYEIVDGAHYLYVTHEKSYSDSSFLNPIGSIPDFSYSTIYGENGASTESYFHIPSAQVQLYMQTNSNGNWYGEFNFPNNTLRFGELELKATDSATNSVADETSSATTSYTSTPTVKTTTSHRKYRRWLQYTDPLCQSFVLPVSYKQTGAWIREVGIYFSDKSATHDPNPVEVQIVKMINGAPSNEVVGTGSTLTNTITQRMGIVPTPNIKHYASSTKKWNEINVSSRGNTSTVFEFSNPVFLEYGVEYGIKIISSSNNYRVWIAEIGKKNINSSNIVTEQPHLGVLFKSQNNSTWTEDQNADLKFYINAARFDISKTGEISVISKANNSNTHNLGVNSIKRVSGIKTCLVVHPNHGFWKTISGKDKRVTISGSTDADLNDTFLVTYIDQDHYTIETVSNASTTGWTGGETMVAIKNIEYDTAVLSDDFIKPASTRIDTYIKTIGSAITKNSIPESIEINEEKYFKSKKYILSPLNASTILGDYYDPSAEIQFLISSKNKQTAPMIHIPTAKLSLTNYKVNSATWSDGMPMPSYQCASTVLFSGTTGISFVASTDTIETTTEDFTGFEIGAHIFVDGSNSNSIGWTQILDIDLSGATKKIYVDSPLVDETISVQTSIEQYTLGVEETSPTRGTAKSKYVTKEIKLDSPATAINLAFGASIPIESNIEIYYRSLPRASHLPLSSIKWTNYPHTFKKNTNDVLIERNITLENLMSFSTFQIKLVFRSENTASIPKINKFRAIALA